MADKILNVKIKQRYDTERNWKSKDPVLLVGEMAISDYSSSLLNEFKYKVGDGTSKWSELPYAYANGITLPTSGKTNKKKWIKFATVDLHELGAWEGCGGLFKLFQTESQGAIGMLKFQFRNGSTAGTIERGNLIWVSLNSPDYANSVCAVSTGDGTRDLYYRPIYDYDTTSIVATDVYSPRHITVQSDNTYVANVTPVTESIVQSYATSAQTANTANSVTWLNVSGKPDTYKPSAHDHTETEVNAMLNRLTTGTAEPTDNDYYISQYVGGGTTTTTYHRRPISALFNYIKGKLAKVASSGSYNDLSDKPVTGTASTSGLTKLYTETGSNTDGTMTQSAITASLNDKANSTHTHTTSDINWKGVTMTSRELSQQRSILLSLNVGSSTIASTGLVPASSTTIGVMTPAMYNKFSSLQQFAVQASEPTDQNNGDIWLKHRVITNTIS